MLLNLDHTRSEKDAVFCFELGSKDAMVRSTCLRVARVLIMHLHYPAPNAAIFHNEGSGGGEC